jgi:hypothetical protein
VIGLLIGLMPLKWSEGLKRAMALGATIIAVAGLTVLLATCWLRSHDRKVIEDHETGISKKITTATEAANATADAKDASRRTIMASDQAEIRKAIDDAEQQHPDEVRRPAGPAARAAADGLRGRAAKARSAAH